VLPLIVRHAYTTADGHLTPYGADTFRTHQDGEQGHSGTHRPRPKGTHIQRFIALQCPRVSWRAMLNVALQAGGHIVDGGRILSLAGRKVTPVGRVPELSEGRLSLARSIPSESGGVFA
jgi:hypothetical protein